MGARIFVRNDEVASFHKILKSLAYDMQVMKGE